MNCVDEITLTLFGMLILEGAHGWARAFYPFVYLHSFIFSERKFNKVTPVLKSIVKKDAKNS